jgi:hypothetical protein
MSFRCLLSRIERSNLGWLIRRRSMQRLNDFTWRPNSSQVANSSAQGKVASFNASGQRALDDIGGEPLVGSGFENEEPESEFAPTEEES